MTTYKKDLAEVFHAPACTCNDCGELQLGALTPESYCLDCHSYDLADATGYYVWACYPGCLPESDPYGPYESEEEAIEAWRRWQAE